MHRMKKKKAPFLRRIRPYLPLVLFPMSFLWLEIVEHLALVGGMSGSFLLYALLFSVPTGILFGLVCSLFGKKTNYILSLCLLGFVTTYFGVQAVYCRFFKDYFYWDLLAVAGDAVTDFWRETLSAIRMSFGIILLLLVPFILWCVFGRRLEKTPGWCARGVALLLAVLAFVCGILVVDSHDGEFDDRYYYREGFLMPQAASRFGILTAWRLDTVYTLFGNHSETPIPVDTDSGETEDWHGIFDTEPKQTEPAEPIETEPTDTETGEETHVPETEPETEPPKPIDTSPQVMDINFDRLISSASSQSMKAAHEFFSSRAPTNKNEYTGLFKGKNLIFITVEAWAPAAINETLTPTLWKMKNEGFVFENYFCSMWGGSTATGEYANMTGNFYRKASCLRRTKGKYQPFATGNVFKQQGYLTMAFHNHTYTYYSRDISHPVFGFDWKAIGNWDKSKLFTDGWPRSDEELAKNSLSYIPGDGSPFHFYYMTVSGHAQQTFAGNRQAKKHRDLVMNADLPYTLDTARSFIASQYEVELMVKTLCDELEKKGILEDTVFVMAPDHYPYMIVDQNEDLNMDTLADLYKLPKEGIYTNYELYRAPLIIWSASMEKPVRVKKVCSAPDIVPTVLNLFGAEYDSRLIIGRDILSDSEGFAILHMSNAESVSSTDNWLTDYGFYSSKTKKFTPFPGVTVAEDKLKSYISHYNQQLVTLSKYSLFLLDEDYYRIVFGK